MDESLVRLAFAALVFVASHVGLSSARVRGYLVSRLGRPVFLWLYSLISLGVMVWLILVYRASATIEFWPTAQWTRFVPVVLMPLAAIFLVAGLATAKATVLSDGRLPAGADRAPGILKVTRHPVMWAFIIWAGAHMAPNGDAAALIFFGSFLILSLLGPARLDAKHAKLQGENFREFAAVTSVIPFAAILQGRNRLSLSDIGWGRIAGGIALYAVLLYGHEWALGVEVFPG